MPEQMIHISATISVETNSMLEEMRLDRRNGNKSAVIEDGIKSLHAEYIAGKKKIKRKKS